MNKTMKSYLKTFLISLVVSFLLVVAYTFYVKQNVEVSRNRALILQKQNEIDNEYIDKTIDKYKLLQIKNPDNFNISLQLGTLYEMKKDFANSEMEYQRAISKAPFGEYKPTYYLSLLYLRAGKLDVSQHLMDNLGEHPNEELIKFKIDVYNKLGDEYYNQSDYLNASYRYKKALFYANSIKSKQMDVLKGNLSSSYIYLAEQCVNDLDIENAIEYLQMARSIIDAPIIKYKLAVLLIKDNPQLAYQYFEDVFKSAPEIINYNIYNAFLGALVNEAENEGNYIQADLYKFKIKKLNEYTSINIISVDDLRLVSSESKIFLNKYKNKYKINFECQFENISTRDISSLFLQVDFKTKNKVFYVYRHQLFDDKNILYSKSVGPPIIITTSIPRSEYGIPKDLTAQIYVSKSDSSYKILMDEIAIKSAPDEKFILKLFGHKFVVPLL